MEGSPGFYYSIITHLNWPFYSLILLYRSHFPLLVTINFIIYTYCLHNSIMFSFCLSAPPPPKLSKMIFLQIFLAIHPVIAAYQHHSNSSIHCPDVVSFCPFRPLHHHLLSTFHHQIININSTSSTTFSTIHLTIPCWSYQPIPRTI